ncbi:MAG TPA: sigma-54 dependent transcriptional regulator [Gemmatimonadaceae bacterium]
MRVLITLTDVEPAVRLNALLEGLPDVETFVVSPMDDLPGAVQRHRPDVIVFSGALLDAQTVSIVRDQLWMGTAMIGLADVGDVRLEERLKQVGFSEVLTKPVAAEEVAQLVRRRLDRHRLARETGLWGESDAVREILVRVEQMAPVSSTVLVEGESGTGKELVARAIHALSPRVHKPFIAVSVGALPETLLESELFGHEKGAFTGAAERRLGRFELAHGGTLFLDEIGEIPISTQVKLLRVLEERHVTRVGGVQAIPVDVRVIAATNRSLKDQVGNGEFRSDLYYRLNVLRIYLPPLRERRGDIGLLVRRFVNEFATLHEREFHGISAEAMDSLASYSWPGNVRELKNLVESMVVLAHGREIGLSDIPPGIREGGNDRLLPIPIGAMLREGAKADGRELEFIVRSLLELKMQVEELRRRVEDDRGVLQQLHGVDGRLATGLGLGVGIEPLGAGRPSNSVTINPGTTMAEVERLVIESALRETRGNRRKAADILDIGERTLYRKLKDYGVPDDIGISDN